MIKLKNIKKYILLFIFFQILLFLVTSVNAASNTWNMDLSTDYTYSNSTSFTLSWSIASLKQNTLVHTWVITNGTTYNWAYDVVVDWDYAYMTSFLWDRVNVLDISNPASPTLVWSVINWWTISLDWASWLVKDWNYLYIASNVSDAIQVIDVSTPTSPFAAWRVVNATNLNWARWIAKVGNYLYVTNDQRDSVAIINVTTPTSPTYVREIRNATSLNWTRDIKIIWNYAYVTWYDWDRFTVLDIWTPPAAPTIVWSITDATNLNWAWRLEVSWNYAYVSAYLWARVRVIDISTPSTPTAVATISGWNYSLNNPMDLIIDWNNLFISSYWSDAINIADITTPTSPIYISKILHNVANPLLDGVYWLYKVWDYIYSAVYNSDALEILKLNYDTTSPYLQPTTSFNYWTLSDLTWFSQTLWAGNEWTITYQISKDNWVTWYYLNWTTWTTTTLWVANSTQATLINSNLSSFNILSWWTNQFTFKAFFTSNWSQKVELDSVTITSSDPQSPGWVSTNVSIWLKSNKWTSTTTDWASLTTWNDWSWNWFNAWWWVSPTYRYNDTENLNYNPIIDFDWTTQYLENLNNWAYSHSYFVVIVPDDQVDWTLAWQVPFWWDCTSWILSSWTCWLTYAWITLWAFTVAMNDEVITHAIWSSTNWRSSQIWNASYLAWRPMILTINPNSWLNDTEIYEKWLQINNTAVNTYQTLSTADYRIWSSIYTTDPAYFDWKIAEIIDFNARVSDIDRQKIESYLAIKYGITLNSWVQNYLASDWTTSIWNSTSAWTYTYDIFGIWRDDISWLWQVKSKSEEADWILTIEAIWEWTNLVNSFVNITDKEFLSTSNNNWSNTWVQTWNPPWYEILSRQWRTQEVWDVWTLNLDFDVANSNFDIPIFNSWSIYYFIYDTDNDNLLSDETPIAMTNPTWNIWRASAINLANWQEFTIAWISSSNSIPTNITLSNNTINENVSIWTTVWTLSTTDADVWDNHTYSFVIWSWDDDNSNFSISWSTLIIQESPDYEVQSTYYVRIQTDDWNGWQYQKAFTININNLWETVNTIIDFEQPWKYTVTSWNWSRVTTNPYEWSYSLQSNNWWVANTQSCFEVNNTFYSWTWTINFHYYVSSQASSDYLKFYIDNVEQQAWSWNVAWATYTNTNIPDWPHTYKWCYIKDASINSWTDNAYIDYITFENWSIDLTPPTITSINYASWSLLPWWNHNLIINYTDADTWINTSSDIIALYKWNWTAWWSDISATWLNLSWKTITTTQATYPTNNLTFWKYYYTFEISDNYWNSSSTWAVFYIDEPEITVNTWTLDLWNLTWTWLNFSWDEITITVETVWAWFQLLLSKDTDFSTSSGSIIIDWDWAKWIWYDQNPYTLINKNINNNQTLAIQIQNINTNWNRNTYTYNIKIWTLIDLEQEAWDYEMNMSFFWIFDY